MAEANRKNWRQLCNAALEAKDPDELLKIVQDLNRALKREEQSAVISGRPGEPTNYLTKSNADDLFCSAQPHPPWTTRPRVLSVSGRGVNPYEEPESRFAF
jgi:hypothetical protein